MSLYKVEYIMDRRLNKSTSSYLSIKKSINIESNGLATTKTTPPGNQNIISNSSKTSSKTTNAKEPMAGEHSKT